MRDSACARLVGFVLPPGQIIIAAAQIDKRGDAALFQEWSDASGPRLSGARRFALYHPMEIVENIAGRAHRLAYSPAFAPIKTGTEDLMRISKAALYRNWLWSSGLAILVFAILGFLDYRLKT